MSSVTSKVLLAKSTESLTLKINRPNERNPLDLSTISELISAISACERDKDIRSVVITGSGKKSFASGVDLKEMSKVVTTAESAIAYDEKVNALYKTIAASPIPVIAKIQSNAIGGGAMLAMACDVAVASDKASFGLPAGRLGLMLSPQEHVMLLQRVSPSKAKYLILTGDRIDARTARQWGMIDFIVDEKDLDSRVDAITASMAKCARTSLSSSKQLLLAVAISSVSSLTGGLIKRCYHEVYESRNFREGVAAFVEKRQPSFWDK